MTARMKSLRDADNGRGLCHQGRGFSKPPPSATRPPLRTLKSLYLLQFRVNLGARISGHRAPRAAVYPDTKDGTVCSPSVHGHVVAAAATRLGRRILFGACHPSNSRSRYARDANVGWWEGDKWVTRVGGEACEAVLWMPIPATNTIEALSETAS